MKKSLLAVCCAFTALFVSCASSGGQKSISKNFADACGDWNLVSFVKEGELLEAPAMISMSLDPQDANSFSVYGNFGINTFRGSLASASNGQLQATSFSSTKKAGAKDVLDFENKFSSFFVTAKDFSYYKKGPVEYLKFTDGEKSSAIFTKNSIYGSWNVTSMKSKNGLSSVNEKLTMTFTSGKTLSASTGINIVSFSWENDSTSRKMTIASSGISTLASGSDQEMATERQFIDCITKSVAYRLSGNDLELLDSSGNITLILERQIMGGK
ncbi:MAG: META domain-containing protein [Treponema sp.]|nr:META domain-containing protein [Treponema sp.]MDY4129901.1 META domain-containing protein [Treponema sp.]